jgi:hypothetical protein
MFSIRSFMEWFLPAFVSYILIKPKIMLELI